MSASMFQGKGNAPLGQIPRGRIPTRIGALKRGSEGHTMSDMQIMQQNANKQHQQAYVYEHGHNDGSAALGKPSF